ncbi:MAG: hypothetical protein QNJ55_28500 [Xenococcus sp. MO_188.B8]|nr:hypothetical protein [Xenococcus sp. MO_188.B8]
MTAATYGITVICVFLVNKLALPVEKHGDFGENFRKKVFLTT